MLEKVHLNYSQKYIALIGNVSAHMKNQMVSQILVKHIHNISR